METLEIIKIRLNGIVACIQKYTNEPTIIAVVQALQKALLENDYDIILFSCKEIDRWYEKNIQDISSNPYVSNHDAHMENTVTIKKIINDLVSNEAYYKEKQQVANKSSNRDKSIIYDIERILNRFHQVVIQLRDRHNDRETIDVSDEYDVQDLLHALLALYIDDIRAEEWSPSYAGTSSRQDFLLKNEKIVIETKKTRKGLGNKELANELIIDIDRYKVHQDCKMLLCFVYDPENRIKNPRGFENDLNKTTDGMVVKVYIRP